MLVPLLPRTYFLWGLRLVLIGALAAAPPRGVPLTVLNRGPAPVKYQSPRDYVAANFASRTMRWTGIIVAAVPRLAPRRPHVGLGQPGLRPRRRVPQPRRQPVAAARWRSSTSSPTSPSASTCSTALEPVPVARLEQPAVQPVAPGRRRRRSPRSSSSATCRSRSPCRPGSSRSESSPRLDHAAASTETRGRLRRITPRRQDPRRADGGQVGQLHRRLEARQPEQQAQVQGASSSAPGSPARRRRPRWPSSATRSRRSRSTTRRAVPTRSPPRAASTPRRTTRATATASTGSSTTRSRAATSAPARRNVYRLAQVSVNIIDQMVAQGVPFAREYGGLLDNRSFGGAQVSRTFYARGQTGQQLLIGAYQQMARQVGLGNDQAVEPDGDRRRRRDRRPLRRHRHPRPADRRGRSHAAHAVVLATGGYGNVFFLSTNAMACNVTAAWRAHRRGACVRQPVLHADPPDVHPAVRRLPVEAHADVGVAAQRRPGVGADERRRDPHRRPHPRRRARLLPRAALPELRQPRPAGHRRRAPPSGPSTPAAASGR